MDPTTHTPTPFAVQALPTTEGLLVRLIGEMDLRSAGQIREALSGPVEAGCRQVVADLRSVTFMDGQGVHALLDARAHSQLHGSRFMLIDGCAAVMRPMDVLEVRAGFLVTGGHEPA